MLGCVRFKTKWLIDGSSTRAKTLDATMFNDNNDDSSPRVQLWPFTSTSYKWL